MSEPAENIPDPLERDVDVAIALCDGDTRAALRAALICSDFLEREIEDARSLISASYIRGKISPSRAASKKLDDWREISWGINPAEES